MSEKKHYLVTLPCKTYIRKYIQCIYGNPVKATFEHSLGIMINLSLSKDIYLDRKLSNSFIHKHYTDKLPIIVNRWQWDRLGFDIQNGKIHLINLFMENLFKEHLFMWVDSGVQIHRERRLLIEQFAALNFIETDEDISFDALKKMEYRKRRELLDTPENVPLETMRTIIKRKIKDIAPRRNSKAEQFELFVQKNFVS